MMIFKQNGSYYLPATLSTHEQVKLENYVEDKEDFIISM